MTHNHPEVSDWKRFRTIVPRLRERYLRDRNAEFIAILPRESQTPDENFWAANDRIEELVGILRACLDDHRRSTMLTKLMLMYRHQMIRDEDLHGFSKSVRDRVATLCDTDK